MGKPVTNDGKSSMRWGGAWIAAVACLFAGACGGMTGDADGAQGSGGSVGIGGTPGSGGTANMTECVTSADCVVGYEGCCAPCEPVSGEEVRAYSAAWFESRPLCDIACAPCAEVEEVDRTGQYFVAKCAMGQCTLVDIREDYTECNTGEDCVLFNGTDCCVGCDDSGFIAVSSFEFLDGKCDGPAVCPDCVSATPEGLSAQCNLDVHHCEVVQK